MKIIRDGRRSFDLEELLRKPLFAHLATGSDDGPRESPVWFHWEQQCLWIIGTSVDSFPARVRRNPKCAIGIVDYDPHTGKVLHAGFRGEASVEPLDANIACRLLARYLGPDEKKWDPRFRNLDASNVLIRFRPETVVVRDQSYHL